MAPLDYPSHFFFTGAEHLIDFQYSVSWVIFSLVLAMVGGFAATAIANISSQLPKATTRWAVQFTGALAFGAAVWGMHFVGMLAISMPMEVNYDSILTLLSALPAVASAWIAIHWLAGEQSKLARKLITAGFIAVGIGAMHYTGMLAIELHATLRFEPGLFVLSLLAAYLLSLVSIFLIRTLRKRSEIKAWWVDAAGGVGFGLAIAAMHYIAMLSLRVIGTADLPMPVPPEDRVHLVSLVALGLLAALGISYAGSLATHLRTSIHELNLRRAQLNQIIQQSMNSVLTIDENGLIETVNTQAEHLFREPSECMRGRSIRDFIPDWHPDIKELELTGIHDRECFGRRGDGASLHLLLRKAMFQVEGKNVFIVFLVDVSEYKETEKELYHQANHDALTGTFNRRHMESAVIAEYKRSRRYGHALSMMMLDIDHFKMVNDNFGHDAGDIVLRDVAARLQRELRATDILCRSGGEEFVLILPETESNEALIIAEKLRQTIASEPFAITHNKALPITLSIGLYTISGQEPVGYQQLIQRADRAMYDAKSNGRNRVERYRPKAVRPTG